MVNYRRNRLRGGTYFFTVTLRNRSSDLLTRQVAALRVSWRRAAERVPHQVLAVVVLPDHLHALIEMRDENDDYPKLWQEIKKGFTRRIGGRGSPWQSRYWEHTIRNDADLQAHCDYIHFNPVKHGYVERASDWPHSSIHRYIERGDLPADWGTNDDFEGRFGEPIR
ncbi:REP-associated tyrosine transposase [Halomonas denitrificans]|nr:transposase [Halomonas denitrificans]